MERSTALPAHVSSGQVAGSRRICAYRVSTIGVDEDIHGGRGDEVCGQLLASDIVKVFSDLIRRQRRRPLGIDFRACGECEGEEWEKAAHFNQKSCSCTREAAAQPLADHRAATRRKPEAHLHFSSLGRADTAAAKA